MKTISVKEMMVPLEEYATVDENASLGEAVVRLEEAQKEYFEKYEPGIYPHRALLVLNKAGKVVGKLSQLDILKALEPKYQMLISSDTLARTATSGFSPNFLKMMMEQYNLFDKPLQDLCRKASGIRIKDCMYSPGQGEYVEENDTLEVAAHQLVVGHHQSLLVSRGPENIVGVLRLVDVFKEISQQIKKCEI